MHKVEGEACPDPNEHLLKIELEHNGLGGGIERAVCQAVQGGDKGVDKNACPLWH